MYLHLRALLQALRDHQDQIVLNYFCLAALSWQYWVKFHQVLMSAVFISMAVLLAVLTVSAFILTVVLYLLYPNYFDHGQPMVASMSWLWMQGHVLYPNWTTGDVYSSVYGPLVFLINGMTLLLNPSIFASKLPGILSLGAALVATSVLFKRTTGNRLTSLFLLASAVMLFVPFGVSAYWNRPEPFLILVSVLALLVAFSQSSLVAAVGIGLLAGLATGLKLHGVIYTVPAAAIALARVETLRKRFILAIIGSACAGATAILPYFEKDVSIAGHLRFLRVALNSGWNPSVFIGNLLFSFILLAPIIVIWLRRKPALSLPDRWLLIALGFSVAIVSVIGSKLGGGNQSPILAWVTSVAASSLLMVQGFRPTMGSGSIGRFAEGPITVSFVSRQGACFIFRTDLDRSADTRYCAVAGWHDRPVDRWHRAAIHLRRPAKA